MARISTITSPQYQTESSNMKKFRLTLDGGQKYIDTYLYLFSNYETAETFAFRKKFAAIPQQAVTAVNRVVDSITARMSDVVRSSPSQAYNSVTSGAGRGVDRRGSSMSTFIVRYVLKELLALKRVAIHVDREQLTSGSTSKAVTDELTPYCNIYKCEEIRSWAYGEDGKLSTILLQATKTKLDPDTNLPTGTEKVYRLFARKDQTVTFTEYDSTDKQISSVTLDLPEIPIVLFELNTSLLENIADMQIVLMNYDNWDAVLMRLNFPMLTKQKKMNPFDIYAKRGVPPMSHALPKCCPPTLSRRMISALNDLTSLLLPLLLLRSQCENKRTLLSGFTKLCPSITAQFAVCISLTPHEVTINATV